MSQTLISSKAMLTSLGGVLVALMTDPEYTLGQLLETLLQKPPWPFHQDEKESTASWMGWAWCNWKREKKFPWLSDWNHSGILPGCQVRARETALLQLETLGVLRQSCKNRVSEVLKRWNLRFQAMITLSQKFVQRSLAEAKESNEGKSW